MSKKVAIAIVVIIVVVAAAVGAYFLTAQPAKPSKFRVALILPGKSDDLSWNQMAFESLKKFAEERDVETAVHEHVAIADAERLMRSYAQEGYDLIIAHGVEYQDLTIDVAKDFPKTYFIVTAGWKPSTDNVIYVDPGFYYSGYLIGAIAGKLTKSNLVAMVYAIDIPTYLALSKNLEMGLKAVNPDAEFRKVATGDWEDAAKSKEAAKALIDAGADFVINGGDGMAVGIISAAKEAGIYTTGMFWDQFPLYPDGMVLSVMLDYSVVLNQVMNDIQAGSVKKFYGMTLENGGVIVKVHISLPSDVQAAYDKALDDIKSGKVKLVTPQEV